MVGPLKDPLEPLKKKPLQTSETRKCTVKMANAAKLLRPITSKAMS
jgi:hypothetical protein